MKTADNKPIPLVADTHAPLAGPSYANHVDGIQTGFSDGSARMIKSTELSPFFAINNAAAFPELSLKY